MALTVLQLVPALKGGGVETGTVDMARGLMAQGHRAIVISSGGPLVKELEAAGAIHYTLPIHRKLPWIALKQVPRVAELIESHGVDVIHARSRVPAIIGYLAWRKAACKASFRMGGRQQLPVFITTAHGYYSKHPFSAVMGWGRWVIANSESIARHMIDDFHVPSDKIRFIPRGVDLEKYQWREPRAESVKGDWVISCIGRITPIKGHRDLIRAFAAVAKTFPKARLRIIGGADARHQNYLQELKQLVLKLSLEDRVEFSGHEPNIPLALAQSDLMVLPSTCQEAFGRVLIEAGASGVPVVATRVGGIPEVILDKKTGLIVPPQDPVALASAMNTLLKDRALALTLARENRRRVETVYPMARMVRQTMEVYQEAGQSLRILVIKLSAVGDIVLITPSLRALRDRFPKAQITVLVGREGRELLHRCPYIDDLVVFDRAQNGTIAGLLRMARRLRESQIDLVIDFQNNRISHWLGRLCGAPHRYGWAGRRWSWLLSHRAIPPEQPLSPVDHQFRLLQLVGVESNDKRLELWPGPSDQSRVDALLNESWVAQQQPLVAIHPGGSWLSKQWPESYILELVDRLAGISKVRVILIGSAKERPICDRIHHAARVKPVVAAGRTSLNELAALLGRCSVFIGGDSAPLHVAAAAGIPIIALFGATDPLRHLPPASSLTLLRTQLPCSPCYRPKCPRVGAGKMECMKSITVETVAQTAAKIVTASPRRNPAVSRVETDLFSADK